MLGISFQSAGFDELGAEDVRTFRRTTTQAVRSIKAHRPRKARTDHVS
jgi:hypothetical protein